MTGLSILYTQQAKEEEEWATLPAKDKTGRLREVYWARRAEDQIGKKSFFQITSTSRPDRGEMGRRPDHPGDGFIYMARIGPEAKENFEWLEVTEVFTIVPAAQIEGAMKAWNGIKQKQPVDFDEFRRDLRRGRPSRTEQRSAANKVIKQINRKLGKTSYQELVDKYGYGTLVVGLPLWFAVLPDNPFRVENVLDDFFTRTALGLQEVVRKKLKKRSCPFRQVIVIWDTTPEAIKSWSKNRSAEYEDVANISLEQLMPLSILLMLLTSPKDGIAETTIDESEVPSLCLHINIKVGKRKKGIESYPSSVRVLREMVQARKDEEKQEGIKEKLRLRIVLWLCKLFCFVRIHRMKGLTRWIARRMSVSHFWKVQVARQQARWLYRKSITRNGL